MTIRAITLVMAACTGLRTVFCLDRMDADKVAAVVFGHIVALKRYLAQVYVNTAAGVTIAAECLGVAIGTVAAGLTGQCPVFAHPVGVLVVFACPVIVMGKGNTLGLVTLIAVL